MLLGWARGVTPRVTNRTSDQARSEHSQSLHIGLQDGFLFLTLVRILLAVANDGSQCLDVETIALGLAVNILDVVRDRLLLFFEPLDAFDDRLELILCETMRGFFRDGGSGGG